MRIHHLVYYYMNYQDMYKHVIHIGGDQESLKLPTSCSFSDFLSFIKGFFLNHNDSNLHIIENFNANVVTQ